MSLNMLNQLKPNGCQCIDLIMCRFLLNGSLRGHTCAFTYIMRFTTNSERRAVTRARCLHLSHPWNDDNSSSRICIWNRMIYKRENTFKRSAMIGIEHLIELLCASLSNSMWDLSSWCFRIIYQRSSLIPRCPVLTIMIKKEDSINLRHGTYASGAKHTYL